MTTYRVTRAFGDKQPGHKITAADMSETDIAYLQQIGAIVPDNDVNNVPKRARKVSTKSEG